MKKKLPAWAVLCIVCLCAGAIVLLANRLTADRIARQRDAAGNAALADVMEKADHFQPIETRESRYAVHGAYQALSAGGETVGYVGATTVTGYGGPVEVTVGLNNAGTITGVSVGGDGFEETPGLGALTREKAFTDQFAGKTPTIALGEGVDSVSGASTTSRAVVSGVNTVANYFYTGELGLAQEEEEAYTGQTVSATKQGFAGDVTATVGLAEDGSIEYLAIDTPNETDGLGKLASEKAFTGQFIGKRGPFAYGEDGIEAISGATYTSTAALEAINEIVSGGGEASAEPVTASAKGYGGDVTVTARLNADNTVAALSVDTPDETDGLGKRCSESEFTDQFIGKAAPFAYGEDGIEAVTGATFTSNAVLEALNSVVPAGDKTAAAQVVAPTETEPEPENAPTDETEAPQGDEKAAADGADYMKYMRPRPAIVSTESQQEETEVGTSDAEPADYMKYMRPRPAIDSIEPQQEETEVGTSDAEPADYMKYMRPRPVITTIEPQQEETEVGTSDAEPADYMKYMRPRPVIATIEPEAAVEEPTAEAEEAPAESADYMKYMRPRPAA